MVKESEIKERAAREERMEESVCVGGKREEGRGGREGGS